MTAEQVPSPSTGATDGTVEKTVRNDHRTVLVDGQVYVVRRGQNLLPDGRVVWWTGDQVSLAGLPTAKPVSVSSEGSLAGQPYEVEHANGTHLVDTRTGLMRIKHGARLAQTHGAHSPAVVNPRVEELMASTVQHAAFLAQPSFSKALEAWARAEVRCALLEEYLDEHGLIDPQTGEPRPATKLMVQLESLALKHRTRLGLDAASRAGIEASLTSTAAAQASLEEILERGAAMLRDRQAAQGSHQEPETSPWSSGTPKAGPSQGEDGRGAQIATGAEL